MKALPLRHLRAQALAFASAFVMLIATQLRAGNTWTGGGGDDNWGTGGNWGGSTPGYGTITFSGTLRTSNVNNSITAMNQVNWTGASAWTMTNSGGTVLSLFDNGGTQAKLESLGTGGVTINAPITFAANNGGPPNPFGEINAVSSNISFTGGTLTVNGSSVNGIKFFGGAGKDVSFANTVSASGKWFGFTSTNSQSVTIATGGNVTTGDFYVMNGGTLNLSGGTLTTSAVRLGGDFGNTGNQNQAFGGTLALTPSTGGVSFSSVINSVSGNTSNNLVINSQNTSGTNTLTGGIFLDSDLKIQQAAGGTLNTSTGTFDVKARKLTVDSSGTVAIGQALSSSVGAGGYLEKTGTGTLTLSSTSNNYTGTNNATLNANGTQIGGGTLAIAGDGSLGLAPAGAYNNIQFTGSATLRSDASISLNVNRNISIASGATAHFDSNGNTFTINGIVNGSGGDVNINGAGGTVILTGANTYTGTTTVSTGTLQIGNGGSSGTLGAGNVINNSALVFNRASGAPNNFVLTNAISGSGTLTQDGANIITISSANSYTGATTINSGILRVTANDALGTNAAGTTVNSGGTLRLVGVNYSTAEALSINGTGVGGVGALQNFSGASTFAGQVTAVSNATINSTGGALTLTGGLVKNGTTLTITGNGSVIVNGTGISGASSSSDLVVDAGTLVVNAASNYNGPTTVQNVGTLVANAAITTTKVTVSSDSTLSGTGSITTAGGGTNYVVLNGALIVGDSTLGSPVASQLDLQSSGAAGSTVMGTAAASSLYFDLFSNVGDNTAIAASADRIKLFGVLDNSLGGTLVLGNPNAMSGFAYGDKWTLFDLSGGGNPSISSSSFSLDYSALGLSPGLAGSFNNANGVFTIVPEPSRAMLILGAALIGLVRRRRKMA